jgi:hypothetical protein
MTRRLCVLPPMFRSGQIIEMETTAGKIVAHLVDINDPEWLNVVWDFPRYPEENEFADD